MYTTVIEDGDAHLDSVLAALGSFDGGAHVTVASVSVEAVMVGADNLEALVGESSPQLVLVGL